MSKKYGSKGKPRGVIRERLALAQGGVCPICEGDDLTADNGTLDRILPGSRGGTYALANLRLAHKKCNSRRRDGDVLELRHFPTGDESPAPWAGFHDLSCHEVKRFTRVDIAEELL